MWKFSFIALVAILAVKDVSAICNVCGVSSGAACISRDEFHVCFDDKPDTSVTFKCPVEGQICTSLGYICEDPDVSPKPPACGDLSKCRNCEDQTDGSFVCTSRTTFTMCMGYGLTESRGQCEEHQLCDGVLAAAGKYPCIKECQEYDVGVEICDTNTPTDEPTTVAPITTTTPAITTDTDTPTTVTTTTVEVTTTTPESETPTTEKVTTTTTPATEEPSTDEPTTTTVFAPTPTNPPTTITTTEITTDPPTTTQNPATSVCAAQTLAGRYPYQNDTVCTSYVYCFWKSGSLNATPMICPEGKYFAPDTQSCGNEKPTGCI